MMRRQKDNDSITPSKGLAKLGHKIAMFILLPLRRPIFFVLLLIALYLVPTFIGAKPNEVHLWYLAKIKNVSTEVGTIVSEKTKGLELPKVELPNMPTFGEAINDSTPKVIDMPSKEGSRKAFEKAKSEPIRVDIMQNNDNLNTSPQFKKQEAPKVVNVANIASKKKLALVYVDGQKNISGTAIVGNANELIINKETIFMYGIYIDPNTQKGKEAKVFLDKTIAGKSVVCSIQAYTYQGIATGICSVDGTNLNKALVENGYSKNVALD